MTSASVALITGGTRGLGRELARALVGRGWRVVLDGRDSKRLAEVAAELPPAMVIPGDVTDPAHREHLAAAVAGLGRLDVVVNNASDLGPSPLPALAAIRLDALRAVYETNVVAPLALIQLVLPALRASAGAVMNVSSDAAVEAYEGWGGYGSSKSALDQLSAVLAVEEPLVRVYAIDPGDMRTDMHQRAFPGENISDRPLPEAIVPSLLSLLDARPGSRRYRASEWASAVSPR